MLHRRRSGGHRRDEPFSDVPFSDEPFSDVPFLAPLLPSLLPLVRSPKERKKPDHSSPFRREIHTVAIVPPPSDAPDAPVGVLTGSEDGSVLRASYERVPGVSDRRLRKSAEAGTHAGGTAVRAVALVPERPGAASARTVPATFRASYILLTAGAKEVLHAWRVAWSPLRSSRERNVDDEGGVSAVDDVKRRLRRLHRVGTPRLARRDARRAREGRPRDVEERMRLRGGVRRVRSEVHGARAGSSRVDIGNVLEMRVRGDRRLVRGRCHRVCLSTARRRVAVDARAREPASGASPRVSDITIDPRSPSPSRASTSTCRTKCRTQPGPGPGPGDTRTMRTVTVACTGATDGTVAAWDLTAVAASIADDANPTRRRRRRTRAGPRAGGGLPARAHQSGVNGLALARAPGGAPGRLLLATGGDDQTFRVAALRVAPRDDGVAGFAVSVLASTATDFAHGSAIKGVWLDARGTAATTSHDQRLRVWRVDVIEEEACGAGGSVRVRVEAAAGSFVECPEPEGLDALAGADGKTRVAVSGRGVQMFLLE